MNDDYKQKNPGSGFNHKAQRDDTSWDEKRKEKVENFELHLAGDSDENDFDPLTGFEDKSVPAGGDAPGSADASAGDSSGVLSSFSAAASADAPQRELTPEEKKAERAAIKMEKRRKKKKAKKNGCLFKIIWLIMIVLISAVLSQYILVGVNDMLAVNRPEQTVRIDIPKDATIDEVSDILAENGIIKRSDFFKLYAKMTKRSGSFTKGAYDMKTNMDYEAIINYMQSQSNRKDVVTVTFTEGMNLMEYADLLEQKNVCSAQEFLAACKSDAFDKEYPFIAAIDNASDRYYKLEGYLFPDTYQFYEQEDPTDTISRFLNNYESKVVKKQQVEGYSNKVSIEDLAKEKGMTPEQLLTLASMVQAEAADKEDMKNIASVFVNRLNADVNVGVSALNSDPTQYYPYKSKDAAPENFESSYDTYKIQGLPAGPICNPGMDAINAALNPNDTSYLYFCHDKNGVPHYARTLEGHEENLRKYGLK